MNGILDTLVYGYLLKIVVQLLQYLILVILSVILSVILGIGKMLYTNIIVEGGIMDFETLTNGIGSIFLNQGINMSNIIYTVALFTAFLAILASGIKMLTSTVGGKEQDSPIQLFIRIIITAVLLGGYVYISKGITQLAGGILNSAKIFSLQGMSWDDLSAGFNAMMSNAMDLDTSFDWSSVDANAKAALTMFGNFFASDVILLIFEFTLLKDFLGATLSFVERFIQLCVYIVLGPIFIAFYPYKETSNVTKEWFMGLLSQILVIYVSCFVFNCFFAQMGAMGSTNLF